jgi:immunity protein 50 of polymorphic toxin system
VTIRTPDIPGSDDVVRWFGYWPKFHDAEVVSITLNRSAGSTVEIYAFERASEVDTGGHYILSKHAVITFILEGFLMNDEGITNTRIDFFNHQNVLSSVSIEKISGGYILVLDGIFGVDGSISCKMLSVKVSPGVLKRQS